MADEIMVAVKLNAQAQPKRFADVLKLVAKGREEINRQVYSAARSILNPKYTREIRLPDETGINNQDQQTSEINPPFLSTSFLLSLAFALSVVAGLRPDVAEAELVGSTWKYRWVRTQPKLSRDRQTRSFGR